MKEQGMRKPKASALKSRRSRTVRRAQNRPLAKAHAEAYWEGRQSEQARRNKSVREAQEKAEKEKVPAEA